MEGCSRRRFLVRSGGLLLALAGCGGSASDDAPGADGGSGDVGRRGEGGPDGDGSRAADGEGCGAREFVHRHGTTVVRGRPGRLLPLTIRDQDSVLALGGEPVGVRDGYYRPPYAEWPWVRPLLEGREPGVVPQEGELNFERVAALRPDLILASASGISARDYEILQRIAPTVAQVERHPDFGAPWQEIARIAGRALCRSDEAAARIEEVDARIARTRERHPELHGATGAVALPGGPDGSFWVYGPRDSRVRFLESLGLRLPPAVAEVTGDRFAATVSGERLDLLDVDVLIWLASASQRTALENHEVYRRLRVAREGRHLFFRTDGVVSAALTNTSVLNVPFLLDEVAPRMAAAVRGEAGGA